MLMTTLLSCQACHWCCQSRGLIYNYCIHTKWGLKEAYHAKVGIYKNLFDGRMCTPVLKSMNILETREISNTDGEVVNWTQIIEIKCERHHYMYNDTSFSTRSAEDRAGLLLTPMVSCGVRCSCWNAWMMPGCGRWQDSGKSGLPFPSTKCE